MNHCSIDNKDTNEVIELFTSVFTSSEGEEEGKLISRLVSELAPLIDNKEIYCFGAYSQGLLVGSIFFTRLTFKGNHSVYMLAPVAVRTEYQGEGIGQSLINYGLEVMKDLFVATVVTYGDPSYYSRVGFQPLSEGVIKAPLELSMPIGWQGCSLTGKAIPVIDERPRCIEAFNDPIYW